MRYRLTINGVSRDSRIVTIEGLARDGNLHPVQRAFLAEDAMQWATARAEWSWRQAASWTLREELRVEDGRITTMTWSDYPIATFLDAPREIDVVFTGEASVTSTGTGEPGAVRTAAAIANAAFDACGVRARHLPLRV